MKAVLKKVCFVLGLGAASCVFAAPNSSSGDETTQFKSLLKSQVDGVRRLPVVGLSMIEAGGKTLIVSDNGRIVVTGKIFDMWHGVELKTLGDADRYANKVDIEKLGLNIDELSVVTIGGGKQEVIIFVDPNCPHCHRLIQSAAKLGNYTFKLVMIPLLSNDSVEKVRKGTCAQDKAAVAKALLDSSWDKIPAPAQDCSFLPMQKSIVTAKVFGVTSVPYLIGHDGTMMQGAPKDLGEWLASLGNKTGQTDEPVKRPVRQQEKPVKK